MSRTETAYDYVDENGTLLYQNVRIEEPGKEKTFYYRRPDGNGGWKYDLDGVRKVPYRLPHVLAAIARGERIFGCEGEKDAGTLEALGLVATSTNGLKNHALLFWRANFALLYDSDKAGRRIRDEVVAALTPICADLRIVHLGADDRDDKFDVTDWVDEGHGKDELFTLVETAHPIRAPKSEDGAALLEQVAAYLNRFVKMLPHSSDALAAYVLHTDLAPHLDVVADVHIHSADKGCGKTVLMHALRSVCAHPLNAGDASVAFIARSLRTPRTVFMDELDALFKGGKERAELLRGILDQGNRRGGTYGRCEPPKNEPVEFPVFGPVVFAGIGRHNLPGTLRDRSIPICQEKMLPDDEVEPLFERTSRAVAPALCERIAAWIAANADAIMTRVDELYRSRREEPVLVRLSTHGFEAWVPLVAICDVAGGEWPTRIRKAAESLMLGEDVEDRTHKERLLANVYEVFEGTDIILPDDVLPVRADRMPSEELAKRLNANHEWEWAEWNHGKGITMRQVANLLREFRIRPKSVREGGGTFKGYLREWFAKVWKAYRIPAPTSTPDSDPSQPSQPDNHADLNYNVDPSQTPDVTDMKSISNPDETRNVTDVTDARQGKGDKLVRCTHDPRVTASRTITDASIEYWRDYADAHPECEAADEVGYPVRKTTPGDAGGHQS